MLAFAPCADVQLESRAEAPVVSNPSHTSFACPLLLRSTNNTYGTHTRQLDRCRETTQMMTESLQTSNSHAVLLTVGAIDQYGGATCVQGCKYSRVADDSLMHVRQDIGDRQGLSIRLRSASFHLPCHLSSVKHSFVLTAVVLHAPLTRSWPRHGPPTTTFGRRSTTNRHTTPMFGRVRKLLLRWPKL